MVRTNVTFLVPLSLVLVACGGGDTTPIPTEEIAKTSAAMVTQSNTSKDGLLTLTMSSSSQQDVTGVNNTYTWTVHNNSAATTVSGVTLGSHWGDYCGGNHQITPPGPTLISMAPGCSGQGSTDIPLDAKFGVWCTPFTGVTLAPGASVSGSVTIRPGSGGPPDYTTYSLYTDPVTGVLHAVGSGAPSIGDTDVVAPAPTDEQITGSASTGSPAVGSNFTYTYLVKNNGPWGPYGGVTFTDTLPTSLTYVGYTASPGVSCGAVGQTVTCTVFDQLNQVGMQSTITLDVKAPSTAQQIVNTATIAFTAPQSDSILANDSVTLTVASK